MHRRHLVPTLALAAAFLAGVARGFPPAPYFTLYGTVRNEQGQRLGVQGASVVFYRNGVEVQRQTITERAAFDQNYQLRLRMDMQRAGTGSYSDLVNATGTPFTLAIIIGNITYYPVEMSVTRTVGKPGQRTRLDLTLGVDSDGDGLPDAWEQSQLFAAGIQPGPNGWDLSLIDRDGDFDGDGLSNYAEYIAGTFATDPTDYLNLRMVGKSTRSVHLQFFGIYSKVYALEASTDLKTWTAVNLYPSNPEPASLAAGATAPIAQPSLQATKTGVVDLYADASADSSARTFFYRLKVR